MAFVIAFVASLVLAFFLRGTVQTPRRRGGPAVLVGMLIAVAATAGWAAFFTLRVYWLGLGILFLMGAVDDRTVLRPGSKLSCQLLAAGIFLFWTPPGVWAGPVTEFLGWLAYPLLLLWIVGVTNALNLLDNMDGLASGVGAIAALGFAWLGLGADWVLVPLGGALAGFLVLNAHRAPIYLGDSGSHLVGFSLATLPLYGVSAEDLPAVPLLLAIPLADTAYVTIARLARLQSPFQGGRDHLSHLILEAGASRIGVLVLFAGAQIGLCAAVYLLWQ